ncbi:MAG: hypothetical protein PHV33_11475 [Elusimicrobiales bacterium]|nr:hypothetical protein [Elusimicrobiales bacterium]
MTELKPEGNLYSREITLGGAARLLLRRRGFFAAVLALFAAAGTWVSLTIGTPLSVDCVIKTAYLPPGGGPESIDEVNERVLATLRGTEPGAGLYAGSGRLDASLWRQTVTFMRVGESRTLQISGRAYSEEGAVKLAAATAEALVVENNAAVAEALRIGELRLAELRRLSSSAGRLAAAPASSADGLKEFARSVSGWSGAEALKAGRELHNLGRAEVTAPPKITRAATLFNRAMIIALFCFLGAVTALVAVLWMEAWRHGAPALF